jgi:glycerol-3-phosphate acyltransferase PlsY
VSRRVELLRKLIHGAFALFPLAAYPAALERPGETRLALALGAGLVLVADLVRIRVAPVGNLVTRLLGPLLRPREATRLLGSTVFLVALAGTFLLLPPALALAAMLFLVVGDAAAAVIGRSFGRVALRGGRTLEGTLACLGACALLVPVLLRIAPDLDAATLLVGAVAATGGEYLAHGEIDNLAMPFAAGLAMTLVEALS